MAEEIKTKIQLAPFNELKEILPSLEKEIYHAEYILIEEVVGYVSEEKEISVIKGLIDKHANLLENIASNYTYYTEQPRAKEILQKAIGLMKRIVEE